MVGILELAGTSYVQYRIAPGLFPPRPPLQSPPCQYLGMDAGDTDLQEGQYLKAEEVAQGSFA